MRTTIKIDIEGIPARSGKRWRLKISKGEYYELYQLLTLTAQPDDFEITVNGREIDADSIELNEKTLWMKYDY